MTLNNNLIYVRLEGRNSYGYQKNYTDKYDKRSNMKLQLIFGIALVLTTIDYTEELFKNRYLQNLKQKAKDYYKSKFGKKGLNFLGYDLSEYPGINKVYRRDNKEKWDEYYKCLNMQKDNLGYHRSFTPEAVQNVEGNSVRYV